MNKVILRGHLGADPRSNTTTVNQKPVCNFRMATNSSWKDAAGVKHEKAEWHNVVCWNALALTVGQHMKKSSQVLVEGRNETREYEVVVQKECVDAAGNVIINPADNKPYIVNVKEKRYTTEVVARSVEFLDKKPGTDAYTQPGVVVGQAPVVAAAPGVVVGQAPVVAAAPGNVAASPFVMAGNVVGTTVAQPGVVDPATVQATFVQPAAVVQPGTVAQPAAGEVVQPVVIAGV